MCVCFFISFFSLFFYKTLNSIVNDMVSGCQCNLNNQPPIGLSRKYNYTSIFSLAFIVVVVFFFSIPIYLSWWKGWEPDERCVWNVMQSEITKEYRALTCFTTKCAVERNVSVWNSCKPHINSYTCVSHSNTHMHFFLRKELLRCYWMMNGLESQR